MSARVHVLLAEPAYERDLAAAFEEEGVPAHIEPGDGDALTLARAAALGSGLGLGVGADRDRCVLVLAASPARPYLEAGPAAARPFGRAVARVAARRPLGPARIVRTMRPSSPGARPAG